MNEKELMKLWKAEESVAHIHGWDFSHIQGRYTEETDLPWDYEEIVRSNLKDNLSLLDIDTGGAEFLLSLNHPAAYTSATEGYEPNVRICKDLLLPMGIQFKQADDYSKLPFLNEEFDLVINRHGNFDSHEIYRILKKGGIFITQQVGENNDRELVELLLPGTEKPFHGLNLKDQKQNFINAGFSITQGKEAYRPIRFFDIGALVWFAKIIEWEFPDFSVDNCQKELYKAQRMIEKNGSVDGMIHRYILVAKKV